MVKVTPVVKGTFGDGSRQLRDIRDAGIERSRIIILGSYAEYFQAFVSKFISQFCIVYYAPFWRQFVGLIPLIVSPFAKDTAE